MHLLTAFSLKNRALIALVTIVAAVFGVIGAGSLKQELMPSVQFPAIAVVTTYQGAAPEVVNADVSGPIETAMRGVPGLESTTATSSTGASMVVAEFTYGIDLAVTEQKVERAISRISAVLPTSADTQVVSGSIDDFPVIQVAVTPADGQTAKEAAALVKRLVTPKLSDLDGVRDAQLSGDRAERVIIRPDFEALARDGLSTQTLTDTLQQSGVLIAGGTVTEGDQTLAVQAGSTIDTVEAIAALPIPGTPVQLPEELPEGPPGVPPTEQLVDPEAPDAGPPAPLTIGAYAVVEMQEAPEASISRVDGKPALTIAVTKMSAANTVEVSHEVQAELDRVSAQLDGAQLTVIFDQAPYIEQSVETLTTEGLLGLLFAVLVILVFLMSVRATLVTAISIPVSVLFTFIGLNFADYTLNMLTLGALTISIGRVVDDSIVVIENIKRHFGETKVAGLENRTAVIVRAVREVAGAITASTVTTVAVFLPMAFVAGMVGELFRPFAFTVTIALAASLFVSLTIVPVLAYWFLHGKQEGQRDRRGRARARRAGAGAADAPTALQRAYKPVIEWTLARPAVTLIVAVAIFGGTIAATPLMKTNFIGSDEQNSVGLTQTLAPGTSLEAQLAQAERVEEVLDGVAAVESVQLTIGSGEGGMAAMFGGGGDGAVNYSITTDKNADQAKAQDDIRAKVEALDDAGEFSINQSGSSPGMSSSIEVNVAAPDHETLAAASDAVLAALKAEPKLKQVESDLGRSRPYLNVTVNRELAAQAGLTEAAVAGQMAQQMQPQQVGQITRDANVTSVYLSNGEAPSDPAGVSALTIQTAVGPQRLDALASVEVTDGPVAIHTADGARSVTVSALPAGDDLTAASAAVTTALDNVELTGGATASVGGVMAQQSEAFEQLGIALLAAILIVYVVMVATFRSLLQPLLLLASVPFAATGALLLLIMTGIPLGVPSLIGVLMLVGIVVTNAIVLVDLVNQYRERGDELREAVLHGTLQRLRPIIMTALATILALTPMALGITGQGGFISQPLAVVVIGGLLSSTVLTLIVLPTLYYAVEHRRERGHGPRRSGGTPRTRQGPGAATAASDAGSKGPGLAWLGSALGVAGIGGAVAAAPDPGPGSAPGPRRTGSTPVAFETETVERDVEPPTATAEMSLALEGLGFDADGANASGVEGAPLEGDLAFDTWNATDEIPPLVLPAPLSETAMGEANPQVSTEGSVVEQEATETTAPEAPVGTEALTVPEVETGPDTTAAPEAEPTSQRAHAAPAPSAFLAPAPGAPPVTGELNWEQLMWEATQEIAAETHPAEDSDRANDTGDTPGEEQ